MSVFCIDENHYMDFYSKAEAQFHLHKEIADTRYLYCVIRTAVVNDTLEDLEKARAIQERVKVEYVIKENKPHGPDAYMPLDMPDWDQVSLGVNRRELIGLFNNLGGASGMFGRIEDTDKLAHAMGCAGGWGGLPPAYSTYIIGAIDQNNGNREYAIYIKDKVPVGAFWSITVYDNDGHVYISPKGFSRNISSFSAEPNADGSFIINFTKNPEKKNAIYIDKGWNYTVRLYEPGEAILNGTYVFPSAEPVPN